MVAVSAFGGEQDKEDRGGFGISGVDVDAFGAHSKGGKELGQSGDAGMWDRESASDTGAADLFAFEQKGVDLFGLELHRSVSMGHLRCDLAQDFFACVTSEAGDNGLLFEDISDLDHG